MKIRPITQRILLILCMGFFSTVSGKKPDLSDSFSYEKDVAPIIGEFCTTCHGGASPMAGISLTSYESVKLHVAEGQLLHRIADKENPMPPSGLLPAYLQRVIRQWAEQGYTETGNTADGEQPLPSAYSAKFKPPVIIPIDIVQKEVRLLSDLQGHWVGPMNLMGQQLPWMAFDYRAIAPAHVHGIFEGGTIGNLFTSFFVTRFNGKKTIMARNGGMLNGIYRTSYFVLDKVSQRRTLTGKMERYYRLVDAYGGKGIMWMELRFSGNKLEFTSYTSRFGLTAPPSRHMHFKAVKRSTTLADNAAQKVRFGGKEIDRDFSKGLPAPDWGDERISQTSASYMWEDPSKSLIELGRLSKDPYRIDQIPFLSRLSITGLKAMEGQSLFIYLSELPLTDKDGSLVLEYGMLREKEGNSILLYPEITAGEESFTFTYLHPGDYYITLVEDRDGDGYPGKQDVAGKSKKITVKPESHIKLDIIKSGLGIR